MSNYKIKVNNESESREAQELFEKIGYKSGCFYLENFPRWVGTEYDECWYTTGFDFSATLPNHQNLTIPQLRDMVAAHRKPTEQGLIGGADAKLAWAKGDELQIRETGTTKWKPLTDKYSLMVFDYDRYELRLKPRTITLNVEIPAPFEPKEGEKAYRLAPIIPCGYTEFYFGEDENEWQFGAWRTEDEIKQVVAALRGVLK